MPNGTASSSVQPTMVTVLTMAGIIEAFLEVYFHSNSSGPMFGTPLMRM